MRRKDKTTWRKEIALTLQHLSGESVIACTLSEEEMDASFDEGDGTSILFTAWTQNYVLFPVLFTHQEWVGFAPRNPCNETTNRQGGSD